MEVAECIDTEEFGKTCVLKCKCPRCEKIYNRRFKYGYYGPIRGPLPFNCVPCEQTITEMGSVEDDVFILVS